MIFRFLMLSDEVDDFRREFRLDADASFLDLHNAIIKSAGYKTGEMASFFLCNDDWRKEAEITLVDMDTRSEVDSYIMEDATLSDFLEDERQKLMYVFDYVHERAFFMELREIIFGEDLDKAEISKSIGNAPIQFLPVEEEPVVAKPIPVPAPVADDLDLDLDLDLDADDDSDDDGDDDDSFYGEDDYNDDELDADGFEGVDEEGESGNVNIDELDI